MTFYDDYFFGGTTWACSYSLYFLHNILSLIHLSEDNMFSVKPRCFSCSDKELAAVCVWSSISHRQAVRLMLKNKVLILKFRSVDGLSSSAVEVSEISSLDHEIRNDSMENTGLISRTKLGKVFSSLWYSLSKKINDYISSIDTSNLNGESNFMGNCFLNNLLSYLSEPRSIGHCYDTKQNKQRFVHYQPNTYKYIYREHPDI